MNEANAAGAAAPVPSDRGPHAPELSAMSAPPAVKPVSPIAGDWKRIAIIAIAGAIIGWSIAALQPARYRASALAAVTPLADSLEPNETLRSLEALERRTVVATIAALASTPVIRTQARAGSDYDLEATVLPNTNLFRIDVEGASPATTATIANRLPQLLSAQTTAMFKYYSVRMVSPAVAPSAPYLPRPMRAMAAGLLIGLFAGVLLAWLTRR